MEWLQLGQLIMAIFGLLTAIVKFAPTLNGGWLLLVIKVLGNITNRQTDDAAVRASGNGGGSLGSVAMIVLFLGLTLSGCGTLSFPSFGSAKAPDQQYKYHEAQVIEPRVVQTNAKGQSVVFNSVSKTVDVNYEKTEKPLTFWQRICKWLSGLSILGILALVALFIIAPGTAIAWLKAEVDKFKKAFTQTVKGIDESKAVETNANLKVALSSNQDASVKALVDDIQQPGK